MNINNEFRNTKMKAMKTAKAKKAEQETGLSDKFKASATTVMASQEFQNGSNINTGDNKNE